MNRRHTDALVRRYRSETEVQGKRGRRRPRKTSRKDIEYLELTEDIARPSATAFYDS